MQNYVNSSDDSSSSDDDESSDENSAGATQRQVQVQGGGSKGVASPTHAPQSANGGFEILQEEEKVFS